MDDGKPASLDLSLSQDRFDGDPSSDTHSEGQLSTSGGFKREYERSSPDGSPPAKRRLFESDEEEQRQEEEDVENS